MQNTKQSFFHWSLFLLSLGIVIIFAIIVVFPALLLRSMGGTENYANINSFETGIWAYPFLVTNFILIIIGILHFKNKIPQPIKKSIRAILDFEVSKEITFLVVTALLGIFIIFTVNELFTEEPWGDYQKDKLAIQQWTPPDIQHVFLQFNFFLLYTSMKVFGNYKVLPFIASISLLVLTYLITSEISKKRFAGIVAIVIVLQSGIFRNYDTSLVYPNFWVLLYVLSLYMIYKKWLVSPLSFILSMFSKGLTSIFIPMTFFFIYRSHITKQKKIFLAISYGIIIVLGMVYYLTYLVVDYKTFSSYDFLRAFNAISYQLRNDGLVVMFLPILIVGLFIYSRRGVRYADSIMILIIGMILSQSFLAALTVNLSEIYRFMPLIVFFAIGVGTILSKKLAS